MTEANKHKYNLIQQYLDGSLDPGRMHELEKEALEDPFLAEALEGYSAFEGSTQPHLSLLQRQLEARIAENAEKKNLFYFTWQRISVAAAASILFISASILFWMKGTNTESRLAGSAKNVEVSLTPGDRLGEDGSDAEKYNQNEAVTAEAITALQQPKNETKVQPKVVTPATGSKSKAAQSYAARTSPAPANSGAPAKASDNAYYETFKNESLVASAGTTQGKLNMRTATGYAPAQTVTSRGTKKFSANDSGSIRIEAFSAASSATPQVALGERSIQPVNGWEDFQAYISKNKRLPAPAGEPSTVIIVFTVDSLGKPDTCRVEKGINEVYNAEAIRLLKEGPLWKADKSDQQNVGYVQVDFK